MQVILLEKNEKLGNLGDVANVKSGYARNYLIPQGFAIMATPSNRKVVAENIKQAAHKVENVRQDAFDLATAIGEMTLTIPAKTGDSGKIFGRVTSLQISEMLKEKGFDIDRKKISFDTEVKTIGDYAATLDLHKEVKHKISFSVVGE